MKKQFLAIVAIYLSLLCKGQAYNDLKDQGYKASVRQITTKYISALNLSNDKWHVTDSLHPGIILIEQFNKEGNFIRKEVRTTFDTSLTEYNYSIKEKPVWIRKNNSGDITETATITRETPDIINEVITDAADSSITYLIRFLDNRKRTKTLEEKRYDSKGKLVYHAISRNEDDMQGLFWKAKIEDKLKNTTDIFDFQFLKKDNHNNPIEILTKKNGKVIGSRLVTILYYPE